jgi:sulfur carrier protein
MKLVVAGETKEFDNGITVEKLIELENVETPEYVTVSVNEEFLSKDDIPTHALNDGDVVEFLYFMGGGR